MITIAEFIDDLEKPFGPIARRIDVELDATGRKECSGEQRKLAQSRYVNTALAPMEDYAYAYQAPISGYTPYYYGVYA